MSANEEEQEQRAGQEEAEADMEQEAGEEVVSRQGEGGGRKRKAWGQLEYQGKRAATSSILADLRQLAEERDTTPVKIAANIIHRWLYNKICRAAEGILLSVMYSLCSQQTVNNRWY